MGESISLPPTDTVKKKILNQRKTDLKKNLTIEKRKYMEALCKTIVAVTNIKGKKVGNFSQTQKINSVFEAYRLDCG